MIRVGFLIAGAMCGLALAASGHADPLRITYAEPLRLQTQPSSAAQKLSTDTQQRLSFDAFGRRFDLEIEENGELLAEVHPNRLQQLGDFRVFRGTIRGNPDSWVRLSIKNGLYSGAIWDGAELYAVDARAVLEPHLDVAPARVGGTLIYRLSDSSGGVFGGTCAALSTSGTVQRTSIRGYKALVRELQQSAPLLGSREITISMLADHDFSERYGVSAMEEMLVRMNIVDGIFDSQVDVNIVAAEFRTFAAGNDPFTTTNSDALIEQLRSYRSSTPEIRSRGLTHLLTGKFIDGDVLGVGYLGALCSADFGVALSEELGSATQTALVMAHEIGHNFGAEHDGQAGSVCSTTPQTFLMSPYLNGSSTFSQCSRDTIAAHVAGASCVTAARVRDVGVSVPVNPVTSLSDTVFAYSADVSSLGEETAYNIVVSASFDYGIQVLSASIGGSVCNSSGQNVNCQIAALAPGETQRLSIDLAAASTGSYSSTVTAVSSVDQVSTNNAVTVPIEIIPVFHAAISFSPETLSVVSGEEFDITATVTATGVGVLNDLQARLYLVSGFNVVSAETASGACTLTATTSTCALGTLAPGESADIAMRLSAIPGNYYYSASVSLTSSSVPNTTIVSAQLPIQVRASMDLAIDQLPNELLAILGEAVELPLVVRSVGARAMLDARIAVTRDPRVGIEVLGSGVTCEDSGGTYECSLGRMEPGAVENVRLRLRADEVLRTFIDVRASPSSGDEINSNSDQSILLDVRPEVDVRVSNPISHPQAYDGVETTVGASFMSFGTRAAVDVTAEVTLPEGFILRSAQLVDGQCTVAGQVATCSIAELLPEDYRAVEVTFVAPEPGTFSGSLSVSAAEDADSSNNSAELIFNVMPNTDAALIMPADVHGFVDEPTEWVFSVVNGRYALADSSLEIHPTSEIEIQSISASRGTCSILEYLIQCPIGTLAPGETVTVTVRATVRSAGFMTMVSSFFSPADVDWQNNVGQTILTIDNPADATVTLRSPAPSARVGEPVQVSFDVIALINQTQNAFVEFDFDPSRVADFIVDLGGGTFCDSFTPPVRCDLGFVDVSSAHTMTIQFVPLVAGETTLLVRTGARNDRNPSNDELTVTVDVAAAATPPPSQNRPPSSGGGGGGGGAVTTNHLLVLFMLMLLSGACRCDWRGRRELLLSAVARRAMQKAADAPHKRFSMSRSRFDASTRSPSPRSSDP